MADPTQKVYPVRKAVNFTAEQWAAIRKWQRAQRPKISEAEGVRQLSLNGLLSHCTWVEDADKIMDLMQPEQAKRKRAEP